MLFPGPMKSQASTVRLVAALLGESLREVAVLVAVFGPLDTIVQGKVLTGRAWATIIVTVIAGFVAGVFLEVKSRWIR